MNQKLNVFFENERNQNFITVALDCEKSDFLKLSDFEKFACVCERVTLFYRSCFIREFYKILSEELSVNIDVNSLSDRENQKQVWKKLHLWEKDETKLVLSKSNPVQATEWIVVSDRPYFNVIEFLLREAPKISYSFDDLVEAIKSRAENSRLVIDMSSFEFVRPDSYHANLAYEKIKSSIEYSKAELSCVVLYIILNVATVSTVDLCLVMDEEGKAALSIVELFSRRKNKKANENVSISLRIKKANEKLFESIFKTMLAFPKKNISSEIIIPEEMQIDDIEDIDVLLSILPASRVKFIKQGKT